jgi:allantoate deiminase
LHPALLVFVAQGPVLEARNQPLGVVSAIAGQTRLWVTINGTQGHAGTVPMRGRQDALATAAAVVTLVEATCHGGPDAPLNQVL